MIVGANSPLRDASSAPHDRRSVRSVKAFRQLTSLPDAQDGQNTPKSVPGALQGTAWTEGIAGVNGSRDLPAPPGPPGYQLVGLPAVEIDHTSGERAYRLNHTDLCFAVGRAPHLPYERGAPIRRADKEGPSTRRASRTAGARSGASSREAHPLQASG